MNVIYEIDTPADYAEIVDHANFVFSYAHEPHEFKTLLPKAYGEDRLTPPTHFLAREDGRIRGLVGILPFTQRVLGEELHVGFIGTVSVHQYARGRGYMKKCMAMSTEWALAHGIDYTALGGQRQRYEYYGYEKGGMVQRFSLTATNCRHLLAETDASAISFQAFDDVPECIPALFALYDSGIVAGARTEKTFAQIVKSWCAVGYAIFDGEKLLGYLVRKGSAITELRLTDWAQIERVFKALFAAFGEKSFEFTVPPYQPELALPLLRMSEGKSCHDNEMFMILNYERFVSVYMKLKQKVQGGLPDGRLILGITGIPGREGQSNLLISVKDGAIDCRFVADEADLVLTSKEACSLLISPMPFVDMTKLPYAARLWFPLPAFVCSADGF